MILWLTKIRSKSFVVVGEKLWNHIPVSSASNSLCHSRGSIFPLIQFGIFLCFICIINYLLTESGVFTGKSQTSDKSVRQGWGLISPPKDQTYVVITPFAVHLEKICNHLLLMRKYVHLRQSAFNCAKCTLNKHICIIVNIQVTRLSLTSCKIQFRQSNFYLRAL